MIVRPMVAYSHEAFKRQLLVTLMSASLPFRFTQNEEFRRLVKMLRSDANVPGRTSIRTELSKEAATVKNMLLDDLPKDSKVSIALDAWQSPFKKSFLAISVYYLTSTWQMKEALIGFAPLTGSHTGESMARIVHNTCQEHNISDRLYCITSDNASSNNSMRKNLEPLMLELDESLSWSADSTKIPCMAHVIQLVVKSILKGFSVNPMPDPTLLESSESASESDSNEDADDIDELNDDSGTEESRSVAQVIDKVSR
jgi:hypothetical protein